MKKHLLPNHKSRFDKKLDEFFGVKLESLDLSVINILANSCPAKLLPILAASFDVSIGGLNEQSAREMIKNAFKLHYYSGTIYTLKKALKAFLGSSKVKEWFSYAGKPYHFKVEIEIANKELLKDDYKTLDALIEEYKNVRSVLDAIEIRSHIKLKEQNALAITSGECIELLPFVYKNREIKSKEKTTIGVVMIEKIKQTIKKVVV